MANVTFGLGIIEISINLLLILLFFVDANRQKADKEYFTGYNYSLILDKFRKERPSLCNHQF